ncbi:MAG: flippase-like domain-containing protein [Actinobacteria bacterium]|nr:flippase-like domain-containing protein [Actinomycetota bacterium]
MDTKVQPPEVDPPEPEEEHDPDEAMPRVDITRRSLVVGGFFVVGAIAFLYFVLPQLADLKDSGKRVGEGNRWWLAAAFAFTVASFGGYVMMFQGIFVRAGSPLDWRASYQITMAGLAATRLFAAGGAGGIALTAWALRRSGMPRRTVADKTLAFLILMYAVYMAALVVCGFGLHFDLLPGPGPLVITVVPAVFALIAIGLALGLSRVPPDLQRRLEGFARRGGRLARVAQRLANAPAAFSAGESTRTGVTVASALGLGVLGVLGSAASAGGAGEVGGGAVVGAVPVVPSVGGAAAGQVEGVVGALTRGGDVGGVAGDGEPVAGLGHVGHTGGAPMSRSCSSSASCCITLA